ncbi:TPA: hypothetical protein ACTPQ1_004670 [Salmonella enterica]
MHDINDYIKGINFPLPSTHTVLAKDELTDATIVEIDQDKRRTYVVLVKGQSYGLSSFDLEQQERFLDEDRRTSLYSAISRAHCKALSTITDSKLRIAVVQGINAMTSKLQEREEFRSERLLAAQDSAKGEEAMALFEGNTVIATAEACYLSYPTFNYTPISDTVGGIKVESMVQWARNNLKFVLSHENETPDGRGQRLQRWLVVKLTDDWAEAVNAELRKFAAIVDLLNDAPVLNRAATYPVVEWSCNSCGHHQVSEVPRMFRYGAYELNISCGDCGKINKVDYKP